MQFLFLLQGSLDKTSVLKMMGLLDTLILVRSSLMPRKQPGSPERHVGVQGKEHTPSTGSKTSIKV